MKIFISYTSYDRWVARKISEDLKRARIDTFLDEKDIETGASINESIETQIKDADEMLLLLSPASLKSTWVFIEIGGAKALGKRVSTILLHVGANEVPQPISHSLCRDINDVEKYYHELNLRKQPRSESKITESMSNDGEVGDIVFPLSKISQKRFCVGDKIKIKNPDFISKSSKQLYPVWVQEMDILADHQDVVSLIREDGVLFMENNDWAWLSDWVEKI